MTTGRGRWHVTPGPAVPAPNLADGIYASVLERIVAGTYPQGGRLPSEVELAAEFAASRPIVRTALARLREDGLIASRQGSGSYVLRRPDALVPRFVPLGSIADIQRCYEFREEVESAAAALAALRRDDADLACLDAAIEEMERCNAEGRLGVEPDAAFHHAVAKASHNPFFVEALACLDRQIAFGMTLSRNLSLLKPAVRMSRVQNEHRAIVAAIRDGDADAARAAMRAHVEAARARMFEGEVD